MLATGAGQESLEDASIGNGHGLFTYYLVDGLTGAADSIGTPDSKVTYNEIQTYVDKNVPSIALQRFKRKQDPVFCCTENSERVISRVDQAYLQNWLKKKKQQNRGGGNSFHGHLKRVSGGLFLGFVVGGFAMVRGFRSQGSAGHGHGIVQVMGFG